MSLFLCNATFEDLINASFSDLENSLFCDSSLNACNADYCSPNRMPCGLINLLVNFVKTQNENPTGIWADFNTVHRSWRNLHKFAEKGMICYSDIPSEPNPSDYPDTESESTVDCTTICGWQRFTKHSYICITDDVCGQLGTTGIRFGDENANN